MQKYEEIKQEKKGWVSPGLETIVNLGSNVQF